MKFLFLLFGAAFGFALSRARATDYNAIIEMFRLRDLHLAGVMGVAIVVSAIGLALLRRSRRPPLTGGTLEVSPKPMHPAILPAGLLFGVGWALSGGCPGTVLTQLGELKPYALFTISGITAGTYAFGALRSKVR